MPFPKEWKATADPVADAVEHAARPRTVGVLLVRLGGFAAGIFAGTDLVESKVGSRQVHGRNSNGGWSQQRYARRRAGQVDVALEAAADVAVRILVPKVASLGALVLGGERKAVDRVLADRRLAPLVASAPRNASSPSRTRASTSCAAPPRCSVRCGCGSIRAASTSDLPSDR